MWGSGVCRQAGAGVEAVVEGEVRRYHPFLGEAAVAVGAVGEGSRLQ